jgi:hypothetical protein
MSYKEWIIAVAKRFDFGGIDMELILFNQKNLIPDQNAEADVLIAKTALCNEFANIIPLSNVTEGGYSITWNLEAIKLWYEATCAELGRAPVNKSKIRNKSNVW